MKVVICAMNSKFVHAALAPWCLKSGLTQYGVQVEALVVEPTVNQPLGEALQMILQHEPQLVGFCCYIWNIEKVLSLCGALKALDPRIQTVLGGPEVSCRAQEVLAL
ncbi:MAG: cobalamin-dependent protein, partial [Clostridia bacterium]|nr:cobalamin-dependent protein [Clostridia bacterium]